MNEALSKYQGRFGGKLVNQLNAENSNVKPHLHSADLFAYCAPAQAERQTWKPCLPDALDAPELMVRHIPEMPHGFVMKDQEELGKILPNIASHTIVEVWPIHSSCAGGSGSVTPMIIEPGKTPEKLESSEKIPILSSQGSRKLEGHYGQRVLRIGLILSGGPAPGGHNVISGLYDYVKKKHPESQVYGMLGGLDGLLMNSYKLLTDEIVDRFRNMGGFDMLWSGRGRFDGEDTMEQAKENCQALNLNGLVIVGGDGSNSNAALVAEYFAKTGSTCCVIGIPKTIDGDLKNELIEASFGFDTCAKTYSELIGNLCTDVCSAQSAYHFTRVMGRSASHLVLECALQTRPNLAFIGEEVEQEGTTLEEIVRKIVDLIVYRRNIKKKKYGVILVPEGLIEFIPEVKQLIIEINIVLKSGKFSVDKLPPASGKVWDSLPEAIQEQLLMERESTGYIQVSKVATERLLILMVESALLKRNVDHQQFVFMPHYFGYEGRCAMPSNFDANYCYALGYNAGVLIDNNLSGYMSVIRRLDQNSSFWQPCGIPFTKVMEVKNATDGTKFPAITKQLVNLNGPLFKVFKDVRDIWSVEDLYRCPGPIQFEGPSADISHYSVHAPMKKDLLWGQWYSEDSKLNERAMCPKRQGCLSFLQQLRLTYRPPVPDLCLDLKAHAQPSSQLFPKDPYTRRQILVHYPYMTNNNHFYLQDVSHDKYTPPINAGLRVGIVFLSRQSPGVINVLWGLYERLTLAQGTAVGFYGLDGLLKGSCIDGVCMSDLELFINQGGVDLLGRSTKHSLVHRDKCEMALQTCLKMRLDGLILVGSAFAMSEAAMLSEYLISKNCSTSIIGVPATGSNNIAHALIETCIGFDSSTKVYASLIGNVLTDAASMPKYWHFIRLMGRQPSHEVLECALQTHPNVVIIAEEYGAADKTLTHVVHDIADAICLRAELGKNFGTVLIPDALLLHLPNMKILLSELGEILKAADSRGKLAEAQRALMSLEPKDENEWVEKLLPWSVALFRTFPKFIRREMLQLDSIGELRFTTIETEELLAQMVREELKARREDGRYIGKFQAVTHFFGYQGRSSMPSQFDSTLAFTHGYLASILVESGLNGYCTTIRGLCGNVKDWKLGGVPFVSLLQIIPNVREIHHGWGSTATMDVPVIPSAEVSLQGKAFRWMKTALEQWTLQDRFCNPGPIQFYGTPATYYNRVLHEEQSEYYEMLRHVECYMSMLQDVCRFGVSEHFLKTAFTTLNGLVTLAVHPDELTNRLPSLVNVDEYLDGGSLTVRPLVLAEGAFGRRAQVSRLFNVVDTPNSVRRSSTSQQTLMPGANMRQFGSARVPRTGSSLNVGDNNSHNNALNVYRQRSLVNIDSDSRAMGRDDLQRKRTDVCPLPGVEEGPYASENISHMLEQRRK